MAEARKPHLYACTVFGGGKITAHNAACMEGLRAACMREGVDLTVVRDGGTGTDRARNRQCARFLESGADAMMQIDDDIQFDPMDVLRMLWTNLPVVGAAYPCKEIDWERATTAVKAGVAPSELALHASRPIFNTTLGGGRVYEEMGGFTVAEVGELPTGFLLIRREALIRFIQFHRDDIEYVADYPPQGAIHHMVFACQRDPRCGRETAKRHMLQAAKKGDTDTLVRAAGEYRATIGDPTSLGRYVTEDYANTVMWRLTGEKAYLAIDVMAYTHRRPLIRRRRPHQLGITVRGSAK
jgi:hypothetical protein